MMNTFQFHLMVICLSAMMFVNQGCDFLAYSTYVVMGDDKADIKAAYTFASGSKVLILFTGATDIDYVDPYAKINLAIGSAKLIRDHYKDIMFIDQQQVDAFQREKFAWKALRLSDFQKRFNADYIMEIDLLRFNLQEENSVNLLRGFLEAEIKVYDLKVSMIQPAYSCYIEKIIPKGAPLQDSNENKNRIKLKITAYFCQQLSRKFYDHTQIIKGYNK